MIEQSLTPEFMDFLKDFSGWPESPHDNRNGRCKCGETHDPYKFQLFATTVFQGKQNVRVSSGFTKAEPHG